MTRTLRGLPAWSLTVAAFLSGITTPLGSAARGQEIPFDEADVFAELNDTDGDLGFHALIDGDAWDRLEVQDPDGGTILQVRPSRSLGQQGLTEIFFESAEPGFDELAPEEFFERFPEGDYEISGRTLEGDELESTARFSHRLPAPPEGIAVSGVGVDPALVDCEGPLPLVPAPVTISWDPVTRSHPEIGRTDERISVVGYQLVVEREESPSCWSTASTCRPRSRSWRSPRASSSSARSSSSRSWCARGTATGPPWKAASRSSSARAPAAALERVISPRRSHARSGP